MREQYFPQWNLPSYYPYISLDLEKESIEYCPQISHILSSLCYGQPILKDQTRHQNITYLRWHIWQRSVCFVTPRRQPSSRGIATWWLRSSAVTTSRHAAFAERQWRFLRSKQRGEEKNNFLIGINNQLLYFHTLLQIYQKSMIRRGLRLLIRYDISSIWLFW